MSTKNYEDLQEAAAEFQRLSGSLNDTLGAFNSVLTKTVKQTATIVVHGHEVEVTQTTIGLEISSETATEAVLHKLFNHIKKCQ